MDYRVLGSTGLKVSRLCFGSLTIGPLQAKLDIQEGVSVIKCAFDMGVNFIDTAELYGTYNYIKKAIDGRRGDIVISTKCYAYNREGAEKSLKKALNELGTDYIDIFSLHEQESELTLKGHREAIEYFVKAKEKGYIRSFGISTHAVGAVKASLKYKEIEVLHPILNIHGLGIIDGNVSEMLEAIDKAYKSGKGIFSMKPLGGGNLLNNRTECFKFVLSNNNLHSIAVGMQSIDEVRHNVMVFEGKKVPEDIFINLKNKKRRLLIDYWCSGCGSCSNKCTQKAITVESGKAVVDPDKCILCGYCSAYCPDFCIKVI